MILMYHKIHPNSPTMWWVTVNDFYRQMSEIQNKKVVYLDEYDVNDTNQVVITFDGIYKNVYEYALPILKHFKYPFELFLTSDYIGLTNEFDSVEPNAPFSNKDELLELVQGGGRLQWHTQTHPNMKSIEDVDIINKELKVPDELKTLDPLGFKWFAYPHGEFNDVVLQEVKKKFNGAVSCNQGNDSDKFMLNRLTVVNNTKLRKNKIACIIASYNYGDYLIEAVESVLHQTILPDEILISDDFSDDDTQIIAESYVKKYPNLISYNRNSKNMGIVDHFNKAISLTKSDYIFFLGADNRLLSNYVEKCSAILDSNPEIAIAYTDYAFFGSRAKLAYQNISKFQQGGIIENAFYQVKFPEFASRENQIEALDKNNFIHGSSMFKRKAFMEIGGYEKTTKAEDYNLFKRMIENGWSAKKVLGTNLEYRQHSIGQANNVVSLNNKLNFYKQMYLQKNNFENTNIYRLSFFIYKIKYSSKKQIAKKMIQKLLNRK